MKIIVAHMSPDLDAIGSVWIIKKFLPGWQNAAVEFVPAGERSERVKAVKDFEKQTIITLGQDEIIHVDTGLGPLDHHQTSDQNVCAASRCWEYVQKVITESGNHLTPEHVDAMNRLVKIIVDYDHFLEVYWDHPDADYHEFSLFGILEGLQFGKPGEDSYFVEFGITCLNALLRYFENKVWAEQEIHHGIEFETKLGKGLGIMTINDSVVKLAQKKGYSLVMRKSPTKGHISIKTRPGREGEIGIDLTLAYEQLRKMDTDATWFLHVSKKMLLNGSSKNPKMKPTKLKLEEIIKVLENIYK